MKITPTDFNKILENYYSHAPTCTYVLGVDFDKTLCYSAYPFCGEETPIAEWLRQIQANSNNKFITIIFSCREGLPADLAKIWLENHNIKWNYFNENDPNRIKVYKDCRKIYCDMLIDDTAWGFNMKDFIVEEK